MILQPLLSVILVSLISLVGVFTLSLREKFLKKCVSILIGLAVGALLGDAFIHLIPEAIAESGNSTAVAITVIAGIFFFLIIETYFHWHHHDHDEAAHHGIKPVGRVLLVSDGIHNLIDGLIIGASYLVSVEVGLATTMAVILHEIPQELGDFGVLIHSGYSTAQALWVNFASGLLAVVGVLLAFLLGSLAQPLVMWLLPLAAGGFIYIAVADLIPELHNTKRMNLLLSQLLAVLVGVGSMVGLLYI